jgi:SAM-dependent methyltransferase
MEPKTNAEWIEWGRRDPLFGVASWKGKESGSSTPWTDEEFYAVGEADWKDFEERWRRYGYVRGTFAEIGCGAGRMTKQLAKTFERGHALDVSDGMIQYASTRIGASNVEWHVTQGIQMPVENDSIDGVFSCHVFQHFLSVDAGYAYFKEIMRTLKPGGTLMIHLPMHNFPTAVSQKFGVFCGFLYSRLRSVLEARSAYERLRMRSGATPPMHGTSYEVAELYGSLRDIGFMQIEFMTFPVTSNGALHSFAFATKPS